MMARPTANLRLFVAAYPPLSQAQQWLDQLAELDLPPHRLSPAHQVHLTLLFIGDTPVQKMDAVVESVERSCSGLRSFSLRPLGLVALPDERPGQPARLMAVETEAPSTLLEMQRRLAARLAHRRGRKPSKPFRPHLTICRLTTPTVIHLDSRDVSGEAFDVHEIQLMRSTLTPDGADHHVVQTFELER